ncbi:hypothetical protein PQR66_19430 [Paraburkholderia agricolaris]|uniref:Uncharacterized protein n=1 Tax=Paraburkholderia agricolaris TaxID=2152888 RepID=A0ABW8ZSS9_9BURK
MTNARTNVPPPDDLKLMHMRVALIPYYVQSVHAGLKALDISKRYHALERIEIRVDGVDDPVHSTALIAYTQTASSMAAIYSRLLLEFLGLKAGGSPSQLHPIVKRTRRGDIGVENFRGSDGSPLEKVLPSIVDDFPDPQEVERAWITTCDFAGQRLAHITDGFKLNGSDVTPMLVRTFETIPQVVDQAFSNKFD